MISWLYHVDWGWPVAAALFGWINAYTQWRIDRLERKLRMLEGRRDSR